MKNKNIVLKTCLTALALSVAGLANAQDAGEPVKIFTEQLTSHAAISAGAISISANSIVDGHIASQAAATIGAGSEVQNIVSGAATGIGAATKTCDIYAGAAIAVGAGSTVGVLSAGGAVTLGALANRGVMCVSAPGVVTSDFDAANAQIKSAQSALETIPASSLVDAYTLFGSMDTGVYEGAAITIPADTEITFNAGGEDGVWIFNLSGALTVGARSEFKIINPGNNNAVIWNIGGALTLGAGSTFLGTAFVEGAVSGATASVSCGNLYATGAISIGSIVSDNCEVSADQLADFSIGEGDYSLRDDTVYALGNTGPAGGIVFYVSDDGLNGLEAAPVDQVATQWGCNGTSISGANGTAVGTGEHNTAAIIDGCNETTAASVASAYGPGWYLPSKDELNLLYLQNVAGVVDGFANNRYWSSSQENDYDTWLQHFDDNYQYPNWTEDSIGVRAVRTF